MTDQPSCTAQITPGWNDGQLTTCGSPIQADGRCARYQHPDHEGRCTVVACAFGYTRCPVVKTKDQRFAEALERGMPKDQAIAAIYEQYPMTVHLGVLTATRPIGARIQLTFRDRQYEGILRGLTPSELSGPFYRLHMDEDVLDLELSHPVTLLTGREGRPEDGHTFRITVESRGASSIMGPDDTEPHSYADDPDFTGRPLHVEVRAHNQRDALRRATEMELRDWRLPDGTSLWHDR